MNSTPTVQPHSFLTLHYRLAGPSGDVINTFDSKPSTLTMGTGELSSVLEQKLLGLVEGSHCNFEFVAGSVFGERNSQMQQWISRQELESLGEPQETYEVGEVVQFPTPDGLGKFAGVVLQSKDTGVLFDFNHPLAGVPVTFEVQIIGIL